MSKNNNCVVPYFMFHVKIFTLILHNCPCSLTSAGENVKNKEKQCKANQVLVESHVSTLKKLKK